jgi:hypothetical protein
MPKNNFSAPYNARLAVDRIGDIFTASWVAADGRRSQPIPLSLPLTLEDLGDLGWYLETYSQFPGAGDRAHAKMIETKIEVWGTALFDVVFARTESTALHRGLLDAIQDGCPATLTLSSSDPEVLVQPWEMMRDRRGPLVFQGVTIRRQLKGGRDPRRLHLDLPLGHGTFLPKTGVGVLAFERKSDAKMELVEGRKLGELLARFEVPLVVLDS